MFDIWSLPAVSISGFMYIYFIRNYNFLTSKLILNFKASNLACIANLLSNTFTAVQSKFYNIRQLVQ